VGRPACLIYPASIVFRVPMERYAFFRASKFAKSLSHHGIAFSPWHCGLTVALQATVGFTDRRCVELTAM
jgi:hypothetical protein